MDGSGARDGFGSPPWGPADPVPELEETQVLPGLGAHPGPGDVPGGQERGYDAGYGAPASPGRPQSRPQPQSWPNGTTRNGDQRPSGDQQPAGGWPQRPPSNGRQPGPYQPDPYQQRPVQPNGGPGRAQPGYDDSAQRADSAQWRPRGSHRAGSRGPGAPGGESTGGPGAGSGAGQGTDQGPDADPASGTGKRRRRSFWRELPVLVIVALVLALVIKSFAIQAFYIPSASMQNTLEVGDRVLINKVVYHLRSIHRGDIIVFDGSTTWDAATQQPDSGNIFTKAVNELEGIVGISHDSSIYIKRVIGLPGDHIVCCNTKGQVTVNGVPLSEKSYLYPGNDPSDIKFKETVPAGMLWVMGDHRAVSYDSRGHMGDPGGGAIPESAVLGRAFVIIWPPSRWGFLNIPATFEQPQLNASKAAGGQSAAGGSTAVLESALANGTPLQPAYSALPIALGLAGAVPLTWLQRRLRTRRRRR